MHEFQSTRCQGRGNQESCWHWVRASHSHPAHALCPLQRHLGAGLPIAGFLDISNGNRICSPPAVLSVRAGSPQYSYHRISTHQSYCILSPRVSHIYFLLCAKWGRVGSSLSTVLSEEHTQFRLVATREPVPPSSVLTPLLDHNSHSFYSGPLIHMFSA